MKYKVVRRKNSLGTPAEVYCASAVHEGVMELEDLAREISGRSSLTEGDILNVLANFVDVLPTYMTLGCSVRLGDFGMLRLTLRSASTPTEEAFTANHIRSVKIVFRPGKRLKEEVKKKQHFECVGSSR